MYYLVIFAIHNKIAKDSIILVRCTEYVLTAIHLTTNIFKRITNVSKDVMVLIWSIHELNKRMKREVKIE
jgi:hypothetical protein